MSSSPPGVLPPPSLDHAIGPIAGLTDEAFNVLALSISGPDGFDLSKTRCRKLAPSVGLNWRTIAYALGAANYLYNRFKALSATEVQDQVSAYVSAIDKGIVPSERHEILSMRLARLVSQDDAIDESKKLATLRGGFLPNLRSIRSFVDVRPNFSEKFSAIKNFVPIVQFRIVTDSDDPQMKQFVFQVDERSLQSFRKAIADAEVKIKTLASSDQLRGLEVRIESDDEDE